jgi:thioesterase domain-containing protein
MLVPIQTSGHKPPLFFVHGMYGVMFLGSSFARALGPDQPFYVINANGIDGRGPVLDDPAEMVRAYVQEIQEAHPTGPVRIAGMCSGCFIAIEIARALRKDGRRTGPVILADPPAIPLSYDKRNAAADARQPQIAQQLHRQARQTLLDHASRPYNDLPFDPGVPDQVDAAVSAALATLVASTRLVPSPFPGPAELIVSAERAPSFFHPQMPWHKLLPGPRIVHVLPWHHRELFREGRDAVARLLKFMLDEPGTLEDLGEQRAERSVA